MRALRRLPPALLAAMAPGPALAHGGQAHGEPGFAGAALAWTFDPWIAAPAALAAVLFALGWRRLHARSGKGRGGLRRRAVLFACGWLVLAGSLLSPLHEAGGRSFTLHMIEHELLMLAAAPLIVLSQPLSILLWAFPPPARRALGRIGASGPVSWTWRRLSGPVPATALQAAALWLWHAPALFNRALAGEGWHAAQHLSFVATALLFWSAMLGRRGGRASQAGARAAAALCLFVTSLVTGALGALMAFSESPWYAAYARLGLAPFGLSPAEDQQLAGLVMWLPGGLVHALAALMMVRSLVAPRPRHKGGLPDAA